MSFEALKWYSTITVGDPTAKHLLAILASFADERGTCFPSQNTLAKRAEVSRRTVYRALMILEQMNLVSIIRESAEQGRSRRNRYRLNLDETGVISTHKEGVVSSHVEISSHSKWVDTTHHMGSGLPNNLQERFLKESAREGVSRDADLIGSGDAQFVAFQAAWPSSSIDSREKAWQAWRKTPPADRAEAVRCIEAFQAETKRHGRSISISAATYLAEKKWLSIKPGSTGGAKGGKVWVRQGTPQWAAWQAIRKTSSMFSTEHRDTGWYFEAEWPPKS